MSDVESPQADCGEESLYRKGGNNPLKSADNGKLIWYSDCTYEAVMSHFSARINRFGPPPVTVNGANKSQRPSSEEPRRQEPAVGNASRDVASFMDRLQSGRLETLPTLVGLPREPGELVSFSLAVPTALTPDAQSNFIHYAVSDLV